MVLLAKGKLRDMVIVQTQSSPMYASDVVVHTFPTAVTNAESSFRKMLDEDM